MGLFDFFKRTPNPDIPVVKRGIVKFKGKEFPLDWKESELPDDIETLEVMRIFFLANNKVKRGCEWVNTIPEKYLDEKFGRVCLPKLLNLYLQQTEQKEYWRWDYLCMAQEITMNSANYSQAERDWAVQLAQYGLSLEWGDEQQRYIYETHIHRRDNDIRRYFPEGEKHLAAAMEAVIELVKLEKRKAGSDFSGYYLAQELISLKKMGFDQFGLPFAESMTKGAKVGNPYCMGYKGAYTRDQKGKICMDKPLLLRAAKAKDYLSVKWFAQYGSDSEKAEMQETLHKMNSDAYRWLKEVPEEEIRDRLVGEMQKSDKQRVDREKLYTEGVRLAYAGDKQGIQLLKKAAAMDDTRAHGQLTLFRAEQGDAEAQLQAGEFYLEGQNGLEKDHAAAVEMFRRAADQNNSKACTRLAECYLNGWGVEQNGVTATRLLRAAAEFSSAVDAGDTARLLARQGDVASAKALYQKALSAEVTDKASAERLRRNCQGYVDLLVSRDGKLNENVHEAFLAALDYLAMSPLIQETEGFKEELLPAAQGNATAIKRLSSYYRHYYNSRGQKIEVYNNAVLMALHMEKIRLHTQAAEQGNIDACYQLWMEYSVYPPTTKEGDKWGWKAIKANYPPMLYGAYLEAESMGISRHEKMKFLYEAARLGNESAILELEVLDMEAEEAERCAEERYKAAKAEAQRALQSKLDWAERDFDWMIGGNGSTMEEKAIRGEISTVDYLHYKDLRDKIESKNS